MSSLKLSGWIKITNFVANMKAHLLALVYTVCILNLFGQENLFFLDQTSEEIKIDGILSEEVWSNTIKLKNFHQKFPTDTTAAISKTEVMVVHDDKFLYVAAICYDQLKDQPFVIQSLKRDFNFDASDAFAVFLNPTQDRINGFSFAVNPFGAQREGVLQRGGVFGTNTSWDQVWYSNTKRYEEFWTLEIAIPFKSIRYNPENKTWGINFARKDLKRNETSCWTKVPINQNVSNLSFIGNMIWKNSIPKTGLNAVLTPYLTAGAAKDYETDTSSINQNIGVDGKLAITPNLNFDYTLFPDFSQVNVDVQQINLTQFSLFFPENRSFFSENADLFAQFGFTRIRPFYSRRIGQNSKVLTGARLTGKLGDRWRIGIMNNQATDVKRQIEDTSINTSENYTVAAVQRQIGKASDLGLIFINLNGTEFKNELNELNWNRIVGLEYNIANSKRSLIGEVFYHQSFQPGSIKNSRTHASFLRYQKRNYSINWNHEYVGKNYTTKLGFVPNQLWWDQKSSTSYRHAYWRLEPSINYWFYPNPKKRFIHRHGPSIYYSNYTDSAFIRTNELFSLAYRINFMSGAAAKFNFQRRQMRLIYPFYISGPEDQALPVGIYTFSEGEIEYSTTDRNPFFAYARAVYGSFYTGTKTSFTANLNYRYQPWGILTLSTQINRINLPTPYTSTFLNLYSLQAQISFTTNLYLTTYLQYNTQADNFNINSRIQYRFKPMSDIFLVYTNNYDILLNEKNRALVLKFVYWLNS